MTGITTPQPRQTIEHPAPVGGGVVHAISATDQARMFLEMTVVGERQPQRFEFRPRAGGLMRGVIGHHGFSSDGQWWTAVRLAHDTQFVIDAVVAGLA